MWDVSGTSGAAPVWAAVMNHLHRLEPSRAPTPPAGLVQSRVVFDGLEAARHEWFIAGTEQSLFAINSGAASERFTRAIGQKDSQKNMSDVEITPKITSPTSGTIIALDPDIPPKAQRVSFKAEGRDLRWLMDGKPLARGAQVQWLPWPGRHVVQLVDGSGKVLDEVKIEVRGAGVKAGR